jgi:hypothetical protein
MIIKVKNMTYVHDLINLRPELKPLKAHIGNSLAVNIVKGLNGRYHRRLDRGIEVASRTKPEQLTSVMQGLLADREAHGGGAPFSIHDVRKEEDLMRALVLGLWTSRVVAPSSVNGTVQIKGKAVYGNEHCMPPVILDAAEPATNPLSESPLMEDSVPSASIAVSEVAPADADAVGSGSREDSDISRSEQAIQITNPDAWKGFLQRAEEIFLNPKHRYSWNAIVTGAMVSVPAGGLRKYMAVDRNTFRGFHKIDKDGPGAGMAFRDYFVRHRDELVSALADTRSVEDLHALLNRVAESIRDGLGNIKPLMLASYNKIRKPVDLYIEHLVAMAEELDESRERLIPIVNLPLDSQMFQQPEVFDDAELRKAGISRRSTYMDVRSENAYRYLQDVLSERAEMLSQAAGRPFYPIYFDLLWNSRSDRPGTNLFELNP